MLLALLPPLCAVTHAQKEAVLEITAINGAQQHTIGTGFFFGDGSTILTCYHVIRGAREIRIQYRPDRSKRPQWFVDVLVQSYSPEHDLATLQARDLTEAMPFLRPAGETPSWKEGQEMATYGSPDGLSYSRLEVRPLHDGYRLSQEIRTREQGAIFGIKDVNLVLLEATSYGGMSGGPVLFAGRCVGVFSGSKNEGGAIGWAIPCLYAAPGRMISVGKAPRDIANWPPLKLMLPGRETLTHSTRIASSTQGVLDEYFAELDKLDALYLQADGHASKALASVTALRLMMQGALARGARPQELFSNPVYKSTRDEMAKSFRALMETRNSVLDSQNKGAACSLKLASVSTALFRDLPRTQKNGALPDEYMRLLKTLADELTGLEQGKSSKEYMRTGQEAVRAMGKVPTNWPEMNGLLKALEAHLSTTLDPAFRGDRTEMMRLSREVGYVWQRVFVEEYDTRDMDWVFNCDNGYSMVIPAGWQIDAWPDTPDSNSVDPLIHKMGLEPCLYVTNRTGKDPRDAVYVAICTFSNELESLPLDKKFEWFQRVVSGMAEGGNVEIQTQASVRYCAVPAESGKEYNYFAMAPRPEKTVYLWAIQFDRKYLGAVGRALPAMVSSVELTH